MAREGNAAQGAARGCGEVGRGAESGALRGTERAGWWRRGRGAALVGVTEWEAGRVRRGGPGAEAEPEHAGESSFLNSPKPKCLLECCASLSNHKNAY